MRLGKYQLRRSVAIVTLVIFVVLLAILIRLSLQSANFAVVKSVDRDANGRVTTATEVRVENIAIGDCFAGDLMGTNLSTANQSAPLTIETVVVVPCSQEHHWEFFSRIELPALDYVESEVQITSQANCESASNPIMSKYPSVSETFKSPNAQVIGLYPNAVAWDRGDTKITCLIGSSEKTFITNFHQ